MPNIGNVEVRLGDIIIAESPYEVYEGVVIEVHDDDTLTILDTMDNVPVKVRVNIDTVDWYVSERTRHDMSREMFG